MIRGGGENGVQSFGDRVRLARTRLRSRIGTRSTQDDMARALGVKRNTISRWENGEALPKDPAIIAALARELHVSADWLLGGLGDPDDAKNGDLLHEGTDQPYGTTSGRAESLPPAAADIVLRYLDRLVEPGCAHQQVQEAERLMVIAARNQLSRRPFAQREIKEVIADVDAAWDLVAHILRRQGIRP